MKEEIWRLKGVKGEIHQKFDGKSEEKNGVSFLNQEKESEGGCLKK